MNYYFDTEFIEGAQKNRFPLSLFRKETVSTIDLISIGIVSEGGREYYAISKDFNLKEAWNRFQMKQVYGDARNRYPDGIREYWIRDNVLKPIFDEMLYGINPVNHDITSMELKKFTYNNFKILLGKYGKTNKQIAKDVQRFIYSKEDVIYHGKDCRIDTVGDVLSNIRFYAYYADYDWVVFCWLFGRMIDLPKGFPMYCVDLKQMLDSKYMHQENKYDGVSRLDAWLQHVKKHPDYPKKIDVHNALIDARWNKKLHDFLRSL